MNKKYVMIIMKVCIVINLIIIAFFIFDLRHNIVRKINVMTEGTVSELNLTTDEKMKDFQYFYDCIVTSLPIETLNAIKEKYHIDFLDRYTSYEKMVIATENDLEFFAVMASIEEDIPTYHTDIVFPSFDYYKTLGGWNINKVLDTRGIYSKSVYWNKQLKEKCMDYIKENPKVYQFYYDANSGQYVSEDDAILVAANNIKIDEYAELTSPQPMCYDYFYEKGYRKWIQFHEEAYSNSLSEEITIQLKAKDGSIFEKKVYSDVVADILVGYSGALGVVVQGAKGSVADQLLYSYCDEKRDVLYIHIAQMSKFALMDVPQMLVDSECKNIIVDLRNNYGGNFDYAVEYLFPYLLQDDLEVVHKWYMPNTKYTQKIFSEFNSKSTLGFDESNYSALNPKGEQQQYFEADRKFVLKANKSEDREHNIYILISGNTASAADKFVAIMKDNELATLIGTNTSGEGRMHSFLADYLAESGLVFIYMPSLAFNADGSNNAVHGTSPNIYVKQTTYDKERYDFAERDPYTYENRLEWDAVLKEAIRLILEDMLCK